MGFYTIDNTDLEKVYRVGHNSVLLFMTYLQPHTKIKVCMPLYLTLQNHSIGFLIPFFMEKLSKIETIDEYLTR